MEETFPAATLVPGLRMLGEASWVRIFGPGGAFLGREVRVRGGNRGGAVGGGGSGGERASERLRVVWLPAVPAGRWRSWSRRVEAPPPRRRAAASSGAGEDSGARNGQGAGGDSEAKPSAWADLCGAGSRGCRVALA